MMKSKIALSFFAALFCSAASAQVYRCPDKATGKLTYSDAPCTDGKQIVRKMTDEERAQSAERAFDSRVRFANERQIELPPGAPSTRQPSTQTVAIPPASRHECEMAQKNAWGVNKEQAQQKADILCFGSAKAASLRIARENRAAAEAEAAERKAARDAETSGPTNITHCGGGICQDTKGGVYHRTGTDLLTGPGGRTCHRAGNMWNCN